MELHRSFITPANLRTRQSLQDVPLQKLHYRYALDRCHISDCSLQPVRSIFAVACPYPAATHLLLNIKEFDPSTVVDTEAIRQILLLYPLAIDGRAFSSLENIFAPDAVANYSAPIGVLAGTSAIATALETALAAFLGTQHHLGASNVRICGNQEQAISATYYRAVHFLSQNSTAGSSDIVSGNGVLYAYGQYQDTWEKRGGQWKIIYRNLVYMVSLRI